MSATIDAALEVARRGASSRWTRRRWRSSRWAGGAGASCPTPRTPTPWSSSPTDPTDPEAVEASAGRPRPRWSPGCGSCCAGPGRATRLVELDLDLRPEGKARADGAHAGSYRAYYEKWSSTWEAQALVRAAHGAGDRELSASELLAGHRRRCATRPTGCRPRQVTEIRKLKARMENERMPRGIDPRRHVKLGPGGLSDVEWVRVQLLQLEHSGGHEAPARERRTPRGALAALEAEEAAVVRPGRQADAEAALREAWVLASRRSATRRCCCAARRPLAEGLLDQPTDAREQRAAVQPGDAVATPSARRPCSSTTGRACAAASPPARSMDHRPSLGISADGGRPRHGQRVADTQAAVLQERRVEVVVVGVGHQHGPDAGEVGVRREHLRLEVGPASSRSRPSTSAQAVRRGRPRTTRTGRRRSASRRRTRSPHHDLHPPSWAPPGLIADDQVPQTTPTPPHRLGSHRAVARHRRAA